MNVVRAAARTGCALEDPITRFVVETPIHTETHRNPVLRFDRVAICAPHNWAEGQTVPRRSIDNDTHEY
jgi:hypothetical protein